MKLIQTVKTLDNNISHCIYKAFYTAKTKKKKNIFKIRYCKQKLNFHYDEKEMDTLVSATSAQKIRKLQMFMYQSCQLTNEWLFIRR